MENFTQYLAGIENLQQRTRTKEVLEWVIKKYPEFEPKIAWNQPMFTNQGTFIIAFSVAKQHLAVSPEQRGMEKFGDEIAKAGYSQSKMLFRIKWQEIVDYDLLDRIIKFNCLDKADCKTFWRK